MFKSFLYALVITWALGFVVQSSAPAQQQDKTREAVEPQPFARSANPNDPFEQFDTNQDDILSKDEIPRWLALRILYADLNANGQITREEFQQWRRGTVPGFPPRPNLEGLQRAGGRPDFMTRAGLQIGDKPADVAVYDDKGKKLKLRERLKGQYTVIVNGCLTCPVFLRSYQGVEAVAHDYMPKGVQFYFLYKTLAHPENNGYVKPYTLEERLMHVRDAKRKLDTRIPWLCDTMANDVKHALGNAPNSEFLFSPEGKIVYLRSWSSAADLRKALEKHIGPVDKPTRISDLNFKTDFTPTGTIATGVVPRVQVPSQMVPVKVKPKPSKDPFYAKLRVEVEQSVLAGNGGKMYIGFHIDPIYKVHWNNVVGPFEFEIKEPKGITLSPLKGKGPKVNVMTDDDPREFLVDVKASQLKLNEPIELKLVYYPCSDSPAWCRRVEHHYQISLERDPDGGAVMGRTHRFGRGASGGRGAPGRRVPPNRPSFR